MKFENGFAFEISGMTLMAFLFLVGLIRLSHWIVVLAFGCFSGL